jgi:hypothetical protein
VAFPEKPRGNEDVLNLRMPFPSEDPLGIPLVGSGPGGFQPPGSLVPYRQKVRPAEPLPEGSLAAHFFLDDFRFEPVWGRPEKGLLYVARIGTALTPDFSLYPRMPLAAQLWQVYRGRWCGAFWRSRGVAVIPTVSWSDERSFPFCFLGIERGSAVAVSTVGLAGRGATGEERAMFRAGYEEMLGRIEPRHVLLYGEGSEDLLGGLSQEVATTVYPSRWRGIREARKTEERDGRRGGEHPGPPTPPSSCERGSAGPDGYGKESGAWSATTA